MRGVILLLLLFALIELTRSRTPLGGLAFALIAILAVAALAILQELDLLGVALAAIYSSVFIFLTLLAMYFRNEMRRGGVVGWASSALFATLLLAFLLLTVPAAAEGGACFGWQDLYTLLGDLNIQTTSFIHILFYRLCAWETLLLNLYLLLGVIVGVSLLALLGARGHRGLKGAWLLASRGERGLWFLRNWRLRGASKVKRQIRHRNSSLIRFKQ